MLLFCAARTTDVAANPVCAEEKQGFVAIITALRQTATRHAPFNVLFCNFHFAFCISLSWRSTAVGTGLVSKHGLHRNESARKIRRQIRPEHQMVRAPRN